jgi:hypothetical protein
MGQNYGQEKRFLGRPKLIWEGNINMDLKEIGRKAVD